ncbi:SDR family oxidoreductase [Candidatus Latescibacterota bacterium]
MKVLVTGALGTVGRAFLAGRPDGCEVELLLDPATQQLPGYAWYRSDITEYEKTEMAMGCSDAEWVVHCAEMADVDRCERERERAFRVNTQGAVNIARACRSVGAKMAMISTDHVFDGLSGPYGEDDRPNPVNVYGCSKYEGEQAATEAGHLLIVRISCPFGRRFEGAGHTFLNGVLQAVGAGAEVSVPGDQFTTPAYLAECAMVLWMLVGKDASGIYHYGTNDRLSLWAMASRACGELGYDTSLVKRVNTEDLKLPAKRPRESGFVTEKIHDVLARPPISFEMAILRMIETRELP